MFKTKAFLCLVLCMCLCTFFIPNALGASQYPLWQPPEPIVDKTPREGKCGENVTWKLDEKGIFTLSGTGAMETYYGNTAPWNSLRPDIKKVVLGGGVTTISPYAFSDCKNLTTVTFSMSGLKEIGMNAFQYAALTDVRIPFGVVTIGGSAFDCPTLKSIFISESVTDLDPGFLGTAKNHYVNIEVHPYNPAYIAIDGMLLTKDKSTLLQCCSAIPSGVCRIPIGVKTIKTFAFLGCNTLIDLTIPEGVETIERFAFEYCSALKTVRLPKSIKEMGLCVFRVCESLQDVYYPGTEEDWARIKFDNAWAHLTGDYTFHYNDGDYKTEILLTIDAKNAFINGAFKENDVAPKIVNGRTMLPIRFLAENLGASVTWYPETSSIFLYDLSQDKSISLDIGSDTMLINGVSGKQYVAVDAPGFIEDGRSYFPVRAISEALYCNVEWIEETRQVKIQKY